MKDATHFIEVWGNKEEYKYLYPIKRHPHIYPIDLLKSTLFTTNMACTTLETKAIFFIKLQNSTLAERLTARGINL